ncbi:MAG: class B sortase [Solobacterium sp.]|nr:class B sortase [Solobacterium sp.]
MKRLLYGLLVTVLCAVIALCLYKTVPDVSDAVLAHKERRHITEVVETNSEPDEVFSKEAFNQLFAINPDLVGYLVFDSGIVSSPVVQGYSNESYLKTSFEREYSSQGTLFMDYNSTLNSQHYTIFGHNVYYDDSAMFSPVSRIVTQEEYEKNRYFSLYTYEGRIMYEITNVIYFTDDDFLDYDYTRTEFMSENDFEIWMDLNRNRNLIHAENSITYQDHFVTLQTCKKWDDHTIILVLAKELGRSSY